MIEIASNDEEWNSFVRHNASSIFHTIEWRDTLQNTFRYKPYYLLARNDGSIMGCLPIFCVKNLIFRKYFISLPYAFSADPIYKNTKTLRELINKAKEISKDSKYLEIRMRQKLPDNMDKDFGFSENLETNLSVLELTKIDGMWSRIDKKHTNAIMKAEKYGFKVREGTENDLKTFYNLKLKSDTRKYGILSEPFNFYRNLWKQMHSKNMVKIFMVEFENMVIGGIVLLLYKDEVVYLSGVTSAESKYLKAYDFLLWEALKYSCKNKYKYFNFGISKNKSLIGFNESWGAKTIHIPIYSTVNAVSNIQLNI